MRTDPRPSRELWFTAPRTVQVRHGNIPLVGPGRVLVRGLASGISQGTELLLYRGEGPELFDPSLDPPGTPTYPRRYGYAWVGEVIEAGDGVEPLAVGSHVFALAPHGDIHVLGAHTTRTIDRAIPPSRATLAASLETAITCVWDSETSLGDTVTVIGGGVIGLLIARLVASTAGRVILVEPSPRRRAVAQTLGVVALPPEEDQPQGDADVVFEATGDPAALDRAIAHAAREATVIVASFYGTRTAPVTLGGEFHRRCLRLRASQVSSIPAERAGRWTIARRFALVRALLEDRSLDELVDPPVSFDSAPGVYARLDTAPGDAMQTVFVYA